MAQKQKLLKRDSEPVPQKPQPVIPLIGQKPSEDMLNNIQDKIFNINFYVSPGAGIPPTTPLGYTPQAAQPSNALDIHKRCIALQTAGFNPSWKKDDVENMYKSQSEKSKLMSINKKFLELTGDKNLSDNLIEECFPGYLSKGLNLEKEIPKPKKQIKKVFKANRDDNDEEEDEDDEYEDTPTQEPVENNLSSPDLPNQQPMYILMENDKKEKNNGDKNREGQIRFINRKKNCNKQELRNDIEGEIEKHYVNVINNMAIQNKIPPGYTRNQIWEGYRKNFEYILNKSVLEVDNMIENYKYKKYSEWRTDLEKFKVKSFSGLPIQGTDFFVPWSLIERYEVCFSKPEDEYRSYPVDFKNLNTSIQTSNNLKRPNSTAINVYE